MTEQCTLPGFSTHSMHASSPPPAPRTATMLWRRHPLAVCPADRQQRRARRGGSLSKAEGDPVILGSLRVQFQLPGRPSVHPPQLGLLQHRHGAGEPMSMPHSAGMRCLPPLASAAAHATPSMEPMHEWVSHISEAQGSPARASAGVAASQHGASQRDGMPHSAGMRYASMIASAGVAAAQRQGASHIQEARSVLPHDISPPQLG